jgi:quercetin dioxygenase-like cupin family protein
MGNNRKSVRIVPIVPTSMARSGHCRPVKGVRRSAPEAFPVHVAIHEVSIRRKGKATPYSNPHVHPDQDEVNLLIGGGSLRYRISLGGRVRDVSAPSAVWIPAGVRHSANAVSGKGFFVCVRFGKPAPGREKPRS